MIYDMIYLLTAIALTPGNSRTVQYSTHLHTNSKQYSTVQYTFTHKQYTVQYSTHLHTNSTQYSTHLHTNSTQYSTVQYNIVHIYTQTVHSTVQHTFTHKQ